MHIACYGFPVGSRVTGARAGAATLDEGRGDVSDQFGRSRRVVIVGAGLGGTATAIRLLQFAREPAEIVLIERRVGYRNAGPAYDRESNHWHHVFNIQAGRMSAFREDVDDFVNWANHEADLDGWPAEWRDFTTRRGRCWAAANRGDRQIAPSGSSLWMYPPDTPAPRPDPAAALATRGRRVRRARGFRLVLLPGTAAGPRHRGPRAPGRIAGRADRARAQGVGAASAQYPGRAFPPEELRALLDSYGSMVASLRVGSCPTPPESSSPRWARAGRWR